MTKNLEPIAFNPTQCRKDLSAYEIRPWPILIGMRRSIFVLPNIEMIGFAYQVEGLSPAECWLSVNKNPRPPDALHPPLTSGDQQVLWAEEQLRNAGVSDKCYIALSCVGSAFPWFELGLPKGVHGLAVYWSLLLVKSALIIGIDAILALHSGERGLSARYYPKEAFKVVSS